MTPDAVKDALHALELRVIREMATLTGKIDVALDLKKSVNDHEARIRSLEGTRRPAWRDLGALIAAAAAVVATWKAAGIV